MPDRRPGLHTIPEKYEKKQSSHLNLYMTWGIISMQ